MDPPPPGAAARGLTAVTEAVARCSSCGNGAKTAFRYPTPRDVTSHASGRVSTWKPPLGIGGATIAASFRLTLESESRPPDGSVHSPSSGNEPVSPKSATLAPPAAATATGDAWNDAKGSR